MASLSTQRHHIERPTHVSDQDWTLIVENPPCTISIVASDGTIVFTNRQPGHAEEPDPVGRSIYSQISPVDRDTMKRSIANAIHDGNKSVFETYEKQPTGTIVWYTNCVKPLINDQAIASAIVITHNITEHKQADQSSEESSQNEIAHQENNREASFASIAAKIGHEINNPLAVIQGYTEILIGSDQPPTILAQLQNILEASRRIDKVIKGLTQLARHAEPTKIEIDANTVIEKATEIKRRDLDSDNIRIMAYRHEDLPPISVDPYQLIQAIVNILTNAQQAISTATDEGVIYITLSEETDYISISISDNGPGFEPTHLEKLFDPFFTTFNPGQGTGLGLSISKAIVEKNNGRLWAESKLGEGATFHLELPIAKNQ